MNFSNIIATTWQMIRRVLTHRITAALTMGCLTILLAVTIATNSRAVTVTDGDQSHVVVTMHNNPHQVLDAAGIELEEFDSISVNAAAIEVERAMAIEVQADGISTLLHMTEGTVQEALDKAGVTLKKADKLNHKVSKPVEDGMLVKVDRVTHKTYKVSKSIDYKVIYKYTSAMRPGQSVVRTQGKEGVRTTTYRKTIVNGKVTDTEKVGSKVTRKPVNKVILKGTKLGTPMSKAPFKIQLDEGGQPVKYKKVLTGSCTAYTNDSGDSGSWTATGKHVAVGLVAVDPRIIPYGTKMWITSADGSVVYGYAIAADTGSALRKGHALADLFMDTIQECNAFGRRNMKIYILE